MGHFQLECDKWHMTPSTQSLHLRQILRQMMQALCNFQKINQKGQDAYKVHQKEQGAHAHLKQTVRNTTPIQKL